MSQNKVEQLIKSPIILKEANLEALISNVMDTKSDNTLVTKQDYEFAKRVIENAYQKELRADNFSIDLTKLDLSLWTKGQYKAFGRLYTAFSDKTADILKEKQEQKLNVANDTQVLWLKLPNQTDANYKVVNGINKKMLNHHFKENTGNEEGITLCNFINTKKPNPITRYTRTNQSISVVIVTEKGQVLLLKRAGLSGRAGSWGALTGTIEWNDTKEKTLVKEVHEEINVLLENKEAHYIGSFHTPNMSKDQVEKDKAASYADDCSYVYGIMISEDELKQSIKLDDENSAWKLFSAEELEQFKVHNTAIHGHDCDPEEMHVGAAKSLAVLNWAKNNFKDLSYGKFTYPYTNSHGFFAFKQSNNQNAEEIDQKTPTF